MRLSTMPSLSLTFQDEAVFLRKLINELHSLPVHTCPLTFSFCRDLLSILVPHVSEEKRKLFHLHPLLFSLPRQRSWWGLWLFLSTGCVLYLEQD